MGASPTFLEIFVVDLILAFFEFAFPKRVWIHFGLLGPAKNSIMRKITAIDVRELLKKTDKRKPAGGHHNILVREEPHAKLIVHYLCAAVTQRRVINDASNN